MRLYRLVKQRYANDLSGSGSKIAGGRWNRKGLPVIYTSDNAALALFETIVHCQQVSDLAGRILVEYAVPRNSLLTADVSQISSRWDETPWTMETVKYCSEWLEAGSHLLLQVPSAIMPAASNFLMNPSHRLFSKVQIISQSIYKPDNRLSLQ